MLMSDFTVAEISQILRWIVTTVGILLFLLLLLKGLTWLLRRFVHRQVGQTDLDLIGLEATVIRSIRPQKVGKVKCNVAGRPVIVAAAGMMALTVGRRVLITAMDKGTARVSPLEKPAPADAAEPAEAGRTPARRL